MSPGFDIENLDRLFENRVRLGIMAVLSVNDSVDFNGLKDLLKITDGNLASHINALEKSAYLKVNKSFVGKKTKTTYKITNRGKLAFQKHLNSLEKLVKSIN
jgi:DNA-binding MarR family transcriptional regulator